jgi:DNA-binding XRE family transcriptional regulator
VLALAALMPILTQRSAAFVWADMPHGCNSRLHPATNWPADFGRRNFMSITPNNIDSSKASTVPDGEIAAAVRQAREAIGYTIDDLSETCGLTSDEITEIEAGADADPAKLRRIATALQVPPSTFFIV